MARYFGVKSHDMEARRIAEKFHQILLTIRLQEKLCRC